MADAIDLFAGWGGFSKGAEDAGARIVWAANHWPLAVEAHALNHPSTVHACQDLNQANFYELPDFDLGLAAPACQGHSQASQPKRRAYHDKLRSTAWAVVQMADAKEPPIILVENVPDFKRWRLYGSWVSALWSLGYSVGEHFLTASHFGVPQRRKRLFLVVTKSKAPLKLNLPTSGPETAFGPCIDWDAGEWLPVTSKSEVVQARVAKGRRNHGARFLTQHVSNHPGVGLDEPIRTITKQDQWAVVDGDLMRPLTILENMRGMGFPDDWKIPERATRSEIIEGLGNAVCPKVATALVREVLRAA